MGRVGRVGKVGRVELEEWLRREDWGWAVVCEGLGFYCGLMGIGLDLFGFEVFFNQFLGKDL